MDVAVLGAGPLGRSLSETAARAGHAVSLHDTDATEAMDAIDEIERRLGDDGADGPGGAADAPAVERIDATTGLQAAVSDTTLAVVTGRADESELQADFAEIEQFLDRDAIVAACVRDCAVTVAAAGLQHPDRAIGLFVEDGRDADVAEVVVADQTVSETVARTKDFVESLGFVAAPVGDAPGFVTTRLALVVEAEAIRLVERGIASVVSIDDAFAGRYGHPMGPLERADRAGLHRRQETFASLTDVLGERFRPPELLSDLVAAGHTGAKSGEGFYVWEDGEPAEAAVPGPDLGAHGRNRDDPTR